MKRTTAFLLVIACSKFAFAEQPKNSDEYNHAYGCAIESLEANYGPGPVAFCNGNAADPSAVELKAYKAAQKDFAKRKTPCPFDHATWMAEGSHADGFMEGEQEETTLKQVVHLLPGREGSMKLFDKKGDLLPEHIVKRLISSKKDKDGYSSYSISSEAKKTCSKKQLG